jgi:hypothetical protein
MKETDQGMLEVVLGEFLRFYILRPVPNHEAGLKVYTRKKEASLV